MHGIRKRVRRVQLKQHKPVGTIVPQHYTPPGLSSQQLHPRGMLYLVLSVLPHQCYSSEVDSTQNYSRVHTSILTEFVCVTVTQHFCFVTLKSLDLRHVNDDSNTN